MTDLLKSKCCNWSTHLHSGDEGTNFFVCGKCQQGCDALTEEPTTPPSEGVEERFYKKFNQPLYEVRSFGIEDYRFVGDEIKSFLSQEITDAVARREEDLVDYIKYQFNGYGGRLGFTRNELINLVTTKIINSKRNPTQN